MSKSTLIFTSAIMLMVASLTFGAEKVNTSKEIFEENSNEIFEEKVETIWIDSNTGSPIDNPNAGGDTSGIFRRCGPWQTVFLGTNCEFSNFCVFHDRKKTVVTTVQQRQCRNGIQQRTFRRSKCGC